MTGYEIVISLWPQILLAGSIVICTIIYAFLYPGRVRDKSVPVYTHKSFIGPFMRELAYWYTYPAYYILLKLKATPNTLTAISPFIAIIAGYLYYKGNFAVAGWVFFLSNLLDFLDGRIARETNRITKEGAYLDSTLDRYSDGIIFGGIALYFSDNIFMLIMSLLTIIGTEITSYAKARGELNGVITRIGLMQRGERFLILWLVSIFYPFIMLLLGKYGITTEYPIIIAMTLMAVLTNFTAIVRILYVFRQIKKNN